MNKLTLLEFVETDFDIAKSIAKTMGRHDTNCAYTSSSDITGLYYFKQNPDDKEMIIVKTKEFGFMVIFDMEGINRYDIYKGWVDTVIEEANKSGDLYTEYMAKNGIGKVKNS